MASKVDKAQKNKDRRLTTAPSFWTAGLKTSGLKPNDDDEERRRKKKKKTTTNELVPQRGHVASSSWSQPGSGQAKSSNSTRPSPYMMDDASSSSSDSKGKRMTTYNSFWTKSLFGTTKENPKFDLLQPTRPKAPVASASSSQQSKGKAPAGPAWHSTPSDRPGSSRTVPNERTGLVQHNAFGRGSTPEPANPSGLRRDDRGGNGATEARGRPPHLDPVRLGQHSRSHTISTSPLRQNPPTLGDPTGTWKLKGHQDYGAGSSRAANSPLVSNVAADEATPRTTGTLFSFVRKTAREADTRVPIDNSTQRPGTGSNRDQIPARPPRPADALSYARSEEAANSRRPVPQPFAGSSRDAATPGKRQPQLGRDAVEIGTADTLLILRQKDLREPVPRISDSNAPPRGSLDDWNRPSISNKSKEGVVHGNALGQASEVRNQPQHSTRSQFQDLVQHDRRTHAAERPEQGQQRSLGKDRMPNPSEMAAFRTQIPKTYTAEDKPSEAATHTLDPRTGYLMPASTSQLSKPDPQEHARPERKHRDQRQNDAQPLANTRPSNAQEQPSQRSGDRHREETGASRPSARKAAAATVSPTDEWPKVGLIAGQPPQRPARPSADISNAVAEFSKATPLAESQQRGFFAEQQAANTNPSHSEPKGKGVASYSPVREIDPKNVRSDKSIATPEVKEPRRPDHARPDAQRLHDFSSSERTRELESALIHEKRPNATQSSAAQSHRPAGNVARREAVPTSDRSDGQRLKQSEISQDRAKGRDLSLLSRVTKKSVPVRSPYEQASIPESTQPEKNQQQPDRERENRSKAPGGRSARQMDVNATRGASQAVPDPIPEVVVTEPNGNTHQRKPSLSLFPESSRIASKLVQNSTEESKRPQDEKAAPAPGARPAVSTSVPRPEKHKSSSQPISLRQDRKQDQVEAERLRLGGVQPVASERIPSASPWEAESSSRSARMPSSGRETTSKSNNGAKVTGPPAQSSRGDPLDSWKPAAQSRGEWLSREGPAAAFDRTARQSGSGGLGASKSSVEPQPAIIVTDVDSQERENRTNGKPGKPQASAHATKSRSSVPVIDASIADNMSSLYHHQRKERTQEPMPPTSKSSNPQRLDPAPQENLSFRERSLKQRPAETSDASIHQAPVATLTHQPRVSSERHLVKEVQPTHSSTTDEDGWPTQPKKLQPVRGRFQERWSVNDGVNNFELEAQQPAAPEKPAAVDVPNTEGKAGIRDWLQWVKKGKTQQPHQQAPSESMTASASRPYGLSSAIGGSGDEAAVQGGLTDPFRTGKTTSDEKAATRAPHGPITSKLESPLSQILTAQRVRAEPGRHALASSLQPREQAKSVEPLSETSLCEEGEPRSLSRPDKDFAGSIISSSDKKVQKSVNAVSAGPSASGDLKNNTTELSPDASSQDEFMKRLSRDINFRFAQAPDEPAGLAELSSVNSKRKSRNRNFSVHGPQTGVSTPAMLDTPGTLAANKRSQWIPSTADESRRALPEISAQDDHVRSQVYLESPMKLPQIPSLTSQSERTTEEHQTRSISSHGGLPESKREAWPVKVTQSARSGAAQVEGNAEREERIRDATLTESTKLAEEALLSYPVSFDDLLSEMDRSSQMVPPLALPSTKTGDGEHRPAQSSEAELAPAMQSDLAGPAVAAKTSHDPRAVESKRTVSPGDAVSTQVTSGRPVEPPTERTDSSSQNFGTAHVPRPENPENAHLASAPPVSLLAARQTTPPSRSHNGFTRVPSQTDEDQHMKRASGAITAGNLSAQQPLPVESSTEAQERTTAISRTPPTLPSEDDSKLSSFSRRFNDLKKTDHPTAGDLCADEDDESSRSVAADRTNEEIAKATLAKTIEPFAPENESQPVSSLYNLKVKVQKTRENASGSTDVGEMPPTTMLRAAPGSDRSIPTLPTSSKGDNESVAEKSRKKRPESDGTLSPADPRQQAEVAPAMLVAQHGNIPDAQAEPLVEDAPPSYNDATKADERAFSHYADVQPGSGRAPWQGSWSEPKEELSALLGLCGDKKADPSALTSTSGPTPCLSGNQNPQQPGSYPSTTDFATDFYVKYDHNTEKSHLEAIPSHVESKQVQSPLRAVSPVSDASGSLDAVVGNEEEQLSSVTATFLDQTGHDAGDGRGLASASAGNGRDASKSTKSVRSPAIASWLDQVDAGPSREIGHGVDADHRASTSLSPEYELSAPQRASGEIPTSSSTDGLVRPSGPLDSGAAEESKPSQNNFGGIRSRWQRMFGKTGRDDVGGSRDVPGSAEPDQHGNGRSSPSYARSLGISLTRADPAATDELSSSLATRERNRPDSLSRSRHNVLESDSRNEDAPKDLHTTSTRQSSLHQFSPRMDDGTFNEPQFQMPLQRQLSGSYDLHHIVTDTVDDGNEQSQDLAHTESVANPDFYEMNTARELVQSPIVTQQSRSSSPRTVDDSRIPQSMDSPVEQGDDSTQYARRQTGQLLSPVTDGPFNDGSKFLSKFDASRTSPPDSDHLRGLDGRQSPASTIFESYLDDDERRQSWIDERPCSAASTTPEPADNLETSSHGSRDVHEAPKSRDLSSEAGNRQSASSQDSVHGRVPLPDIANLDNAMETPSSDVRDMEEPSRSTGDFAQDGIARAAASPVQYMGDHFDSDASNPTQEIYEGKFATHLSSCARFDNLRGVEYMEKDSEPTASASEVAPGSPTHASSPSDHEKEINGSQLGDADVCDIVGSPRVDTQVPDAGISHSPVGSLAAEHIGQCAPPSQAGPPSHEDLDGDLPTALATAGEPGQSTDMHHEEPVLSDGCLAMEPEYDSDGGHQEDAEGIIQPQDGLNISRDMQDNIMDGHFHEDEHGDEADPEILTTDRLDEDEAAHREELPDTAGIDAFETEQADTKSCADYTTDAFDRMDAEPAVEGPTHSHSGDQEAEKDFYGPREDIRGPGDDENLGHSQDEGHGHDSDGDREAIVEHVPDGLGTGVLHGEHDDVDQDDEAHGAPEEGMGVPRDEADDTLPDANMGHIHDEFDSETPLGGDSMLEGSSAEGGMDAEPYRVLDDFEQPSEGVSCGDQEEPVEDRSQDGMFEHRSDADGEQAEMDVDERPDGDRWTEFSGDSGLNGDHEHAGFDGDQYGAEDDVGDHSRRADEGFEGCGEPGYDGQFEEGRDDYDEVSDRDIGEESTGEGDFGGYGPDERHAGEEVPTEDEYFPEGVDNSVDDEFEDGEGDPEDFEGDEHERDLDDIESGHEEDVEDYDMEDQEGDGQGLRELEDGPMEDDGISAVEDVSEFDPADYEEFPFDDGDLDAQSQEEQDAEDFSLAAATGEADETAEARELDMDQLYAAEIPSIPSSPTDSEYGPRGFASPAEEEYPATVPDEEARDQQPTSPSVVEPSQTLDDQQEDAQPRDPVRFSQLYRQSIDWQQLLDSPSLKEFNAAVSGHHDESALTVSTLDPVPESADVESQAHSQTLTRALEQMTPIAASPLSPRPPDTPPPDSDFERDIQHDPGTYCASDADHSDYSVATGAEQQPQYAFSRGPRTFDEMGLNPQQPSPASFPCSDSDLGEDAAEGSSASAMPRAGHVSRRSLSQRFSGWWSGGGPAGRRRSRSPPPPVPYDNRYGESESPV